MSNKIQKPCKTCGKMFTPCGYCEKDNTMFHWRRVACSIECASKYFEKIEKSRKTNTEAENKKTEPQVVEAETVETFDAVSENTENTSVIEEIKPKRTRKKNDIKIEESEQID